MFAAHDAKIGNAGMAEPLSNTLVTNSGYSFYHLHLHASTPRERRRILVHSLSPREKDEKKADTARNEVWRTEGKKRARPINHQSRYETDHQARVLLVGSDLFGVVSSR